MQAHLHGVEVEDAVALDDDLAVERRASAAGASRAVRSSGKVAQQRTCVPRPETELARAVLEEPSEAVPLRLVLPLVAFRQIADELRLHRRERDRACEIGRPLDRLARADARPGHGLKLLRSPSRASRRRHRSRSRHPARARCAVDVGRGGRRTERRRLDPRPSTRANSRCASPPRSRGSSRSRSSGRRTRGGSSGTSCSPSRPHAKRGPMRASRGRPGACGHPRRLRDRRRDGRARAGRRPPRARPQPRLAVVPPERARRLGERARSRSTSAFAARTTRRCRPARPARTRWGRARRRSAAATPTSSSPAAPRRACTR